MQEIDSIMRSVVRGILRGLDSTVPVLGVIVGIFIVLALLSLCGCIAPTPETPEPTPAPKPVIVEPITDDTPDALTLTVNAESSLVATLHEIIGDRGSVTLNPEQPIVVSRPEATLAIKPGTVLTYSMGGDGGTFTFSEPRPRVTAKVWGLRVSPELTRLDLSADNTGTAHVQSGPVKLTRRFALNWEQPTGTAAEPSTQQASERRKRAIYFGATWCGPCRAVVNGEFPKLVGRGWKIGSSEAEHIQVVDTDQQPEMCKRFNVTSLPTIVILEDGSEVRRITGQFTAKQFTDAFYFSGRYQGRSSNQWTFPGKTKSELIAHLQSGEHAGKFNKQQLDAMSFAELLDLHSDDHEGVVDWLAFRSPPPGTARPPTGERVFF